MLPWQVDILLHRDIIQPQTSCQPTYSALRLALFFLLNTHIKKSEGKLLEYSAENIAKRQLIYMGAERTAKALEWDSHNKYGKVIA